jgi:Transglutaminase-like superfamily
MHHEAVRESVRAASSGCVPRSGDETLRSPAPGGDGCQDDGAPCGHRDSGAARVSPDREPLFLRPGVILIVRDGLARLLDLDRAAFFALDAIGTQLLTRRLELGEAAAVIAVAREYSVPPDRVLSDWGRLLRELHGGNLVTMSRPTEPSRMPGRARPAAAPRRRRMLPNRWAIGWLLALAWVSLRVFGWARSVHLWQRGYRPQSGFEFGNEDKTILSIDAAIREVASGHWLNTQCKERALVAWRILKCGYGMPAELVIGVVFFPFGAHVWVECGPWTVTDDRARCNAYTPVGRYS